MPVNQLPGSRELRKLLAFGTGVGIEIRGHDLHVVMARVRPSGVNVLGCAVIANFTSRPAAEWGGVYNKFLKRMGGSHLSATVLLPREEVIVRHLALPGVAAKDMEGAIRFQIDTLHPYGEDEAAWGWSRLENAAVLVGIMRRQALERYAELFNEAGVAIGSFTFSAAAVHAAIRLNSPMPSDGFVAISRLADESVEVYGESSAHPVFSAAFELAPERAAALAAAELRLPVGTGAIQLAQALPKPRQNPVENDLSRNALPYATALAGACPRLAPAANLLPPERRTSTSRAVFLPTLLLAGLLVAVACAMLIYNSFANRRYLDKLQAEIAQLEPQARKAGALDRQADLLRARTRLLDDFRGHTRADLDAFNELTKLLSPPIWTNSIDLTRDTVTLSGEAAQASGLIKILDASPLFEGTDFNVIARSGNNEMFRVRTNRRDRK